jgi:hypothetical protein
LKELKTERKEIPFMKRKYEIAIPSYQRSKTLVDKTLRYLYSTDVKPECVTVFVADTKEFIEYKKALHGEDSGVWIKRVNLVIGKPTLKAQRAFIRKYYKEYTHVFNIDDDIEGLYYAKSSKHTDMQRLERLDLFIRSGFELAQRVQTTLWGMNAVCNPFFMFGKGISTDLKYICGGAYGEIIRHKKSLDVELEDKEDFERSILHFKENGRLVRFNEYSLKTKGYAGAGGMQVTRTKKRVKDSAMFLLKKYPQYCKLNTGKKNKEFVEVKLIKQ